MIITNIKTLSEASGSILLKDAQDLISKLEMELRLSETDGVGLAAPQIGIKKRVAIIRIGDRKLNLVNPKIMDKKDFFISKNEGCLSLPGVIKDTWRYKEIFVIDDFHPEGFIATDFDAIVIQHEIDHLNGILIIDYKTKVGRNEPCPCGAKQPNGKPIKFKKCHGRNF